MVEELLVVAVADPVFTSAAVVTAVFDDGGEA